MFNLKQIDMTEPKYLLKIYTAKDVDKYDCFCDIPEEKIKIGRCWEDIEKNPKKYTTIILEFETKKQVKNLLKELGKLEYFKFHYLEGELIDN